MVLKAQLTQTHTRRQTGAHTSEHTHTTSVPLSPPHFIGPLSRLTVQRLRVLQTTVFLSDNFASQILRDISSIEHIYMLIDPTTDHRRIIIINCYGHIIVVSRRDWRGREAALTRNGVRAAWATPSPADRGWTDVFQAGRSCDTISFG